jgi:hypothetical protein
MSTDERADERETETDETKDPKEPLTQREVFELYLRDKALRPHLFGALGGLAMVFLVLFLNGSDIGAVTVTLIGLAALVLRWTGSPPVLLLVLFYFLMFPFGVPEAEYENPFQVRETHFRVVDVVLVLSLLVYLRCLYRVLGVVQQSMPFENVLRRKDDHPTRRPTGHIAPNEIAWLVGTAAVVVILGQAVWWLVNALEFTPTDEDFPLRWADPNSIVRYRRTGRPPGEFSAGANRFFVFVGLLFFGFLVLRLVFGYWRLRAMTAAEGAMVTTDTSWAESHRERVRVEKWRMWGRQKAADRAKEEARAERARQRKEDAARQRAEARGRERRLLDEHVEEAARSRRGARAGTRTDEPDETDRPRRRR